MSFESTTETYASRRARKKSPGGREHHDVRRADQTAILAALVARIAARGWWCGRIEQAQRQPAAGAGRAPDPRRPEAPPKRTLGEARLSTGLAGVGELR